MAIRHSLMHIQIDRIWPDKSFSPHPHCVFIPEVCWRGVLQLLLNIYEFALHAIANTFIFFFFKIINSCLISKDFCSKLNYSQKKIVAALPREQSFITQVAINLLENEKFYSIINPFNNEGYNYHTFKNESS